MANHRLLSGSDYKLETGLRTGLNWFCVSSFLGSELSAIGRLWNLNESFIWLRLSWWVIIKHLCEGIENHKLNQGSNNFCISYFWGLRNHVNILCQQFWIKRQHSINGYPGDQIFYTLSNGVKYIECHLIRGSRESGQKLEEGSETVRHKKNQMSHQSKLSDIFIGFWLATFWGWEIINFGH